jgi:hypothetical protein
MKGSVTTIQVQAWGVPEMPKILKVAMLVVALAGTWLPCVADAQNRLPPCPSTRPIEEWTNCYGTSADAKGNLYEGDFKDGKRQGQGVDTFTCVDRVMDAYSSLVAALLLCELLCEIKIDWRERPVCKRLLLAICGFQHVIADVVELTPDIHVRHFQAPS